ncbi:hypothetical protein T4A_2990 [Trichinella pseudospiralis]|uniref:Uncharacterized protein n=1 Tax=Trichinella pseudospiralis TaxID=6337 RepID=A0A0V1EXM9_TRIPS|nr:hypothetical protein T4A_2990 [Trichinella pseudospiralis]
MAMGTTFHDFMFFDMKMNPLWFGLECWQWH